MGGWGAAYILCVQMPPDAPRVAVLQQKRQTTVPLVFSQLVEQIAPRARVQGPRWTAISPGYLRLYLQLKLLLRVAPPSGGEGAALADTEAQGRLLGFFLQPLQLQLVAEHAQLRQEDVQRDEKV